MSSRHPRHGYGYSSGNNTPNDTDGYGYQYGGRATNAGAYDYAGSHNYHGYGHGSGQPSEDPYQNAYADYYSSEPRDGHPSSSQSQHQPHSDSQSRGNPRRNGYHARRQAREARSQSQQPRRRSPLDDAYSRRSSSPTVPPSSQSRAYSTPSSPYKPPPLYSSPRAKPPHLEPPPPPQERERSPSPPKILHPSPSYLATSLTPSASLQNPSTQRKLLILDLNGTLLIRPKRSIESNYRHQLRKGQQPDLGPKFRPVHPRPYMPTFREYLFLGQRPTDGEKNQGEGTKAWLDVMVWSSAQPHSVGDMVGKCFGAAEGARSTAVVKNGQIVSDAAANGEKEGGDLVAIWARDTLGLSEVQYHQKAQTTKDLEKPWSALPLVPPHITHSAQTTLLLDDSPLKAQLQPWNHVCIKEYDSELRRGDLETLGKEHAKAAAGGNGHGENNTGKKKRKRKEKKDKAHKKADPEPLGVERHSDSSSSTSLAPASDSQPAGVECDELVGKYDETLLAVIGILDTIKAEDNVAGWMRAGGLWGPYPPASLSPTIEGTTSPSSVPSPTAPAATSTGNDVALDPVQKPDKDGQADGAAEEQTLMWFDHEPTFNHWASKGREAVERLGISLVHGIVN